MRRFFIVLLPSLVLLLGACSPGKPGDMVLVRGGAFKNQKSNYSGKNTTVPDFYIGKFEVTQKEWTEVMGNNPSRFKGDDLPLVRQHRVLQQKEPASGTAAGLLNR